VQSVEKIYIPGRGELHLDEYRVHRAVQEYDERLMFGRNELTGDWCVFVKMPHGEAPVAVIGFGREIPDPAEAVRRADAANTRKHGSEILDASLRHNAAIRETFEEASAEGAEAVKEALDWAIRVEGE